MTMSFISPMLRGAYEVDGEFMGQALPENDHVFYIVYTPGRLWGRWGGDEARDARKRLCLLYRLCSGARLRSLGR